jgi:hypothetical protein
LSPRTCLIPAQFICGSILLQSFLSFSLSCANLRLLFGVRGGGGRVGWSLWLLVRNKRGESNIVFAIPFLDVKLSAEQYPRNFHFVVEIRNLFPTTSLLAFRARTSKSLICQPTCLLACLPACLAASSTFSSSPLSR